MRIANVENRIGSVTNKGLVAAELASIQRALLMLVLLVWMIYSKTASCADWPQILGPNRDCVAAHEQVRRDWGKDRPRELWQREVGEGLAGVAVADGRAVLFHRLGNEQVVEAMDAESGKNLWEYRSPTGYVSTISPDSGPRCTPLIHDGAVYTHGADGQLTCLEMADGKLRWRRDTFVDFDVRQGYFGAGSSPVVAGELLLLNVGGRKQGGIVAFSLIDGATVWHVPDEQASYSSPTLVELDGARHALFVTRYNFLSLDPLTGKVRFRVPFGQRGPTVNAATPIVVGNHVFVSASYGVGARWIEIGKDGAEMVWSRDDLMSSQYATCVLKGDALFGIDGRQDGPPGSLRCFDPTDGSLHWSENNFGMATLIRAGDTLLVMKTDGELVLVDAKHKEYRELARWLLLDGTARALPALADGRFYVRDETTLKCFDVGVEAD